MRKVETPERGAKTVSEREAICVGTFVVGLWILANVLQDLHDVHDRLQNLTKMVRDCNSTGEYSKFPHDAYLRISFHSGLE